MENQETKPVEAVKVQIEIVHELKVKKGNVVETFYEPVIKEILTIDPKSEAEQLAMEFALETLRKAGIKLILTDKQAQVISKANKERQQEAEKPVTL